MNKTALVLCVLLLSSMVIAKKGKASKKSTKKMSADEKEFNKEIEIYQKIEDKFCWRRTYGRGVGKVPKNCKEKSYNQGLCYKHCNKGYNGIGPVCWKFPKSYGRGGGSVPKACLDNKQFQAGLCYPFCKSDYSGVGPVCWKKCLGETPVNCGAACASTTKACVSGIFNMVKAVLNMIKTLATTILTGGTASLASKSAELLFSKKAAIEGGINLAKLFVKKGYSKKSYEHLMKSEANKIGKNIKQATLDTLFESGKAKGKDIAKLSVEIFSAVDPTGIGAVVEAFLHDLC